MKKITVIALLLAAALGAQARNGSGKPAYKDAGRPVEERVSDLLSRMTLEEKVMQLNQYTLGRNDNANNVADPVDKIPAEIGSLIYFDTSPGLRNRLQKKAIEQSRLGIPVLFGYDVIHGFRTTYPISLAQACSWNPALVKQAAEVAAQEARMSGVEWTFSPMIDVARDGRWGRVSEGYGEDPYANAVYGVAAVEGYQGDNLADSRRVAACLKHFVGYGASEAGRDYVYTEISRQTLWDTYIPPYQAGIEAGAATVMSCFNDISGTPGTANPYILTEVLKERWAHDGFVVSDWAAIEQLRSQGVAADRKEAAEKAFNAGVEMDMMNRCYDAHLAALVREGKVSQEKLDEAVRRVLRLKFRLGLFERPYTPESEETDRFLLPASLAVAERLAEESMVLLKNENNTLPLKAARRIAVIGPMAQNRLHLLGAWSAHGREEDAVSLFAGLENEYRGRAELLYARGCDFDGEDRSGFREAGRGCRRGGPLPRGEKAVERRERLALDDRASRNPGAAGRRTGPDRKTAGLGSVQRPAAGAVPPRTPLRGHGADVAARHPGRKPPGGNSVGEDQPLGTPRHDVPPLDGPDSDLLQPPPERPHPSGQISGHPQHAAL